MSKQIDISLEGLQDFLKQVQDATVRLYHQVIEYFSGLGLFQIIAWGAIGLGLVLVIVALILW